VQIVGKKSRSETPEESGVIDTSELTVGQSVRVNDGVRPSRFSGKIGIIVENRREEVGIRFGRKTSHTAATWFRHHEINPAKVGQIPVKAPESPDIPKTGAFHLPASDEAAR
jgi:hypothetical protein